MSSRGVEGDPEPSDDHLALAEGVEDDLDELGLDEELLDLEYID